MPEINAATGALTIPIWAVSAVAAVFVVLMMLAVAQAGTATAMNTLYRASIVIAVVCAGWIYSADSARRENAAARRALDERSAALLARAVAPGSAFSCLNELAGEAVEAACEKAVFGSPEAAAAAVSYVTAELNLLADGSEHARKVDPAYAAELAPVRAALERDRFGIVAHVLGRRGCTPEKCDALELFSDPAHVVDNLRDHVFDDRVTKFTAAWNAPPHGATTTADATLPPALRPVGQQYDFPSAESIPPINIMAPEPGTRNANANPNANTGAGQGPPASPPPPARQTTTPVPQKRPPQRTATQRPPPPPHQAPPPAAEPPPTDGAATTAPQQ